MKESPFMNVRKLRRESPRSEGIPDSGRLSPWVRVEVECYSGYRAEETPRAVILGGARLEISEVLSRERRSDHETRRSFGTFSCRLADGRALLLEKSEEGTWRARLPSAASS
jgi:hypothetical protein